MALGAGRGRIVNAAVQLSPWATSGSRRKCDWSLTHSSDAGRGREVDVDVVVRLAGRPQFTASPLLVFE
jgi:hypothetical protein